MTEKETVVSIIAKRRIKIKEIRSITWIRSISLKKTNRPFYYATYASTRQKQITCIYLRV